MLKVVNKDFYLKGFKLGDTINDKIEWLSSRDYLKLEEK